jgi:hypothetical protein
MLFKIGDVVKVDKNKRVDAFYEPIEKGAKREKRVMRRSNYMITDPWKDEVKGIITGMKRFLEGEYFAPSNARGLSYGGHYEDYEPGGIHHEKTVRLWCVRTGLYNKEIYFFPEDIVLIEKYQAIDFSHKKYPIPQVDNGWSSGCEDYKKQMSRESKSWPRDEKGRFCK